MESNWRLACDGLQTPGFFPVLIARLVANPSVWVIQSKYHPDVYFKGALDPAFPLLVAWDLETLDRPAGMSFPYGELVLPD